MAANARAQVSSSRVMPPDFLASDITPRQDRRTHRRHRVAEHPIASAIPRWLTPSARNRRICFVVDHERRLLSSRPHPNGTSPTNLP